AQTGDDFLFSAEFLKQSKRVTLDVRDINLEAALPLIFHEQPFDYSVEGKILSIHPRPLRVEGRGIGLIMAYAEVRGRVVDSLGNPLAGASVRVLDAEGRRSALATQTEQDGTFVLRNVPEDSRLRVSYV